MTRKIGNQLLRRRLLMRDSVIQLEDKVYALGRQTDKQSCLDAAKYSMFSVLFHKTIHSVQHGTGMYRGGIAEADTTC